MSNSNSASIVEAYKSIRATLEKSFSDHSGAVSVAVVSPSQGDGRTTAAINTAVAFSQVGKKVLLIDGDMLRGTVHKKMKVSSMFGLADLLASACDFDRAAITVSPTLDVITAGTAKSNSAYLLSSEEFTNLLNGLGFIYDVIIIDTPAAAASSDAELIAAKTDGAVLVVRADQTLCKELDYVINAMENRGVKLLGTVLNAVK